MSYIDFEQAALYMYKWWYIYKVLRLADPIELLFSEELGIVVEVESEHVNDVTSRYAVANVPCVVIGSSLSSSIQVIYLRVLTWPYMTIVVECVVK